MKFREVTKRELSASIAAFALSAVAPFPAAAQIAGRPITIIVPYSPGTGIDILARSIATDLSQWWWTTGPAPAAISAPEWRRAPRPTATRC